MTTTAVLAHCHRWKTRGFLFVGLVVPLYILPSLCRMLLLNNVASLLGLLIWHATVCLVVAFITNSYPAAVCLFGAGTAFELVLALLGQHRMAALWIGDAIPALVAIYFVQQMYLNMGE